MRENICKWYGWQLWCCRRLGSPLGSKEIKLVIPKGNQSWIFIAGTVAEVPVLKEASWCEEPTHWKRSWCWERLKANGEGTTEDEMLDDLTDWLDISLSKLWEMVKDREAWRTAVHLVEKSDTNYPLNSNSSNCHQASIETLGCNSFKRYPLHDFLF